MDGEVSTAVSRCCSAWSSQCATRGSAVQWEDRQGDRRGDHMNEKFYVTDVDQQFCGEIETAECSASAATGGRVAQAREDDLNDGRSAERGGRAS
mmetsp:Transcript_120348/g.384216  ORF Transcript_120348/g.384216 Transcript_120348/m.384216 type:complete len:95 (-) Transcript_120348:102-386(-)